MGLPELSALERSLRQAFNDDAVLDLRNDRGSGDARGSGEVIRAAVIESLLLDEIPPRRGRVPTVRLAGADVGGDLVLDFADIGAALWLEDCRLDGVLRMRGAKTRSITLTNCALSGVEADDAHIEGSLGITGCHVGEISLNNSSVTGTLDLSATRLGGSTGPCLSGRRMTVGGSLDCTSLECAGGVQIPGAEISDQLTFDGGRLKTVDGPALLADRISVGSGVSFDAGFVSEGTIRLRGARVAGNAIFGQALLTPADGPALDAERLHIGGDLQFSGGLLAKAALSMPRSVITGSLIVQNIEIFVSGGMALDLESFEAYSLRLRPREIVGAVNLANAEVDAFLDDPLSWPARLVLAGFTYRVLEPPLTARERLRWLHRDTQGYTAQPYEQLAAFYRREGLEEDAVTILLANERDRRACLPLYGKILGFVQDAINGYGYRPLRLLVWLVALLTLGTLFFTVNIPRPTDFESRAVTFNAFLYTLEQLLPIGGSELRDAYTPVGSAELQVVYMLRLLGWLFILAYLLTVGRLLARRIGWAVDRANARVSRSLGEEPPVASDTIGAARSVPTVPTPVTGPSDADQISFERRTLRSMYVHGLAQARVSFIVSVFFASLGALILLVGVGLAIYHAESGGQQYASIVASTAGTVIDLSAGVFFLQSNRARRDMAQQATLLRDDGLTEKHLELAQNMLTTIEDTDLKNRTQAEIALRLLTTGRPGPARGETGTKGRSRSKRKLDQIPDQADPAD